VALAGRLLAAAKALNGQPALLAVICENAYALGLREPSGLEIAIEAMELEIASIPEKKADCQQKILALRLRQFNASKGEERLPAAMPLLDALLSVAEDRKAAGDYDGAIALCRQALGVANAEVPDSKEEITAKMAAIAQAKQKAAELAKLEAALKANSNDDPKRKQLLWLYLVDMNNPAEAAKWVRDGDDSDIRKYVPAAAKDVSEAPELA